MQAESHQILHVPLSQRPSEGCEQRTCVAYTISWIQGKAMQTAEKVISALCWGAPHKTRKITLLYPICLHLE